MFARRNLGDHFVELSFLRIETRDAQFGCSPVAAAKIKTQTPRPNPAANSDCEHAEAEAPVLPEHAFAQTPWRL
ncbi:MAG: hypothetical protein QOF09_3858 [Alphaproteobacteria bacterium]|nr:hypothetical protein [Alphaproteobacteria bacterium]